MINFPEDWIFGGANGDDPRADPRFRPDSYRYSNQGMEVIIITSVNICDDEAIDYAFSVGHLFREKVMVIEVKRNGGDTYAVLWTSIGGKVDGTTQSEVSCSLLAR